MNIDIYQVIAVFRLIPLAIAFWIAFRQREVLPALIAVTYVAAIVFGARFLNWSYATAVFSTPLAYMVSWYIIKNVRSKTVRLKDDTGKKL